MKETVFPTKNCRSAKKIAQLRQLLKSNDSATFVIEMYIYRTKKYFMKLYKRCCIFNLLLMHFSFLSSSCVKIRYLFCITRRRDLCHGHFVRMLLCYVQVGASSGVFFVNKVALPLVDFKTNI